MNLTELSSTLNDTLATGKTGTPVAVRIHLQSSDPKSDLTAWLANCGDVLQSVFSTMPATLMARENDGGNQLNVLLKYQQGQTAMLTVGRGATGDSSLHFLLIGNHGVIRLEGAEPFADDSAEPSESMNAWRSAIKASLQKNAAVSFSPVG